MRLIKRTIRLTSGYKIIQLMTPMGKIVAEFHDPDLWAIFLAGVNGNLSIYDDDICGELHAA